jgi:hypothetical protein
MMLEHYQQTKCLLVSYSDKPLGLFYRPAQAVRGGLSNLLAQAVQYAIQNVLHAPGLVFAFAEDGGQIEPPLFLMREAGDQHAFR